MECEDTPVFRRQPWPRGVTAASSPSTAALGNLMADVANRARTPRNAGTSPWHKECCSPMASAGALVDAISLTFYSGEHDVCFIASGARRCHFHHLSLS